MNTKSIIIDKFQQLDACLARIRQKVGDDISKLEDDLDIQEICTLNLQRAAQLCIDVAVCLIRSRRLPLPTTMKGYFDVLGAEQIVSPDLAQRMARMVGFRNIAVHDYGRIDPLILKAIVSKHLVDFTAFQAEVLQQV